MGLEGLLADQQHGLLAGVIRWRAVNPPGSVGYHAEPLTVQHFTDWFKQCGLDAGESDD